MTVNPRPRTVNEMAFYIDGVEKSLNDRLDVFDEKLTKLEKSLDTLKHLLITSLLAPIIVIVVAAIIVKDLPHA